MSYHIQYKHHSLQCFLYTPQRKKFCISSKNIISVLWTNRSTAHSYDIDHASVSRSPDERVTVSCWDSLWADRSLLLASSEDLYFEICGSEAEWKDCLAFFLPSWILFWWQLNLKSCWFIPHLFFYCICCSCLKQCFLYFCVYLFKFFIHCESPCIINNYNYIVVVFM